MIKSVYLFACLLICSHAMVHAQQTLKTFAPTDSLIQYTGRTIISEKQTIRCWAPGVYMQAKFTGNNCKLLITDEVLYGQNHNYIEIVFDNQKPVRLRLKNIVDTLSFTLPNAKTHTVTICKNTEAGIGYLDFCGIQCKSLVPLPAKPARKIEYIGNSITCGAGMDLSAVPCDSAQWFDQHNAYMSYGAVTARKLNAQYHISAVSGIGLIHSCCAMTITMPQVFNKVSMHNDDISWDFVKYQPDVVTVCLGQNDGIQDSLAFCSAYITFVNQLRTVYPNADIVCLNSPMANAELTAVLKSYTSFCTDYLNKKGDAKVHHFFFSKSFNHGCGGHPDMKDHQQIAAELTAYIKQLKSW